MESGRVYHTKFNPPKVEGKDDVTGEPLIQRKDDNEETLRKRLDEYRQQTTPVLEYFKRQSKLVKINGNQSKERVLEEVFSSMTL